MSNPLTVVTLFALGGSVAAQSVQLTATALAPVAVQCSSGAQAATNQLPLGPLPLAFFTQAGLGPAGAPVVSARADGFAVSSPASVQFTTTNYLVATGPTMAASATQDLLLQLSATAAVPVTLRVEPSVLLTPGAPAPLLEVDIGNDGFVDWVGWFGSGPLGSFVLTPQAVPIRVRIDSQVSSTSVNLVSSTAAITLMAEPDNQLGIQQAAVGCSPNSLLAPIPVFDGLGVELFGAPGLMVIGLGAQPLLLGPTSPLPFLPGCLWLPTIDLLSFELDGQLRLPLPASVRPATVYVQTVLLGTPFTVSDAYRILAF